MYQGQNQLSRSKTQPHKAIIEVRIEEKNQVAKEVCIEE